MDSIICYYIKILYYVFPNANIERDILEHTSVKNLGTFIIYYIFRNETKWDIARK